jgi:hypothetical protein
MMRFPHPPMQAVVAAIKSIRTSVEGGSPPNHDQLLTLKQVYALSLANVREIENMESMLRRSKLSAMAATAEVKVAIEVMEQKLGITQWDCDCGNKTTDPKGCEECLMRGGEQDQEGCLSAPPAKDGNHG